MKKKKMNKIKQKALTEALLQISIRFEADFWSSFTHKGEAYDIHYLDDEDIIVYVYKVIDDIRDEHELFIMKIYREDRDDN